MKIVRQKIHGKLVSAGGRHALLLYPDASVEPIYLAYALVTFGREEHVLPASILDDWGNERKTLQLYQWVADKGMEFPRAEIFGLSPDGEERQQFLREFDLQARHPVYGFPRKDTPVTQAVLVDTALVPASGLPAPSLGHPPEDVEPPLRLARLDWWYVPLGVDEFNFLASPAANG